MPYGWDVKQEGLTDQERTGVYGRDQLRGMFWRKMRSRGDSRSERSGCSRRSPSSFARKPRGNRRSVFAVTKTVPAQGGT
jgi:hypothetical protein